MFLPHLMATIIDPKLSSRRIISAASLATYVPAIPIAKPTSALFSAAASFVPSPVTATTWPSFINPVARRYLSYGVLLASTLNSLITYLNFLTFRILYTSLPLSSLTVTRPPTISLNSRPYIAT